jgi:hypothetical protein
VLVKFKLGSLETEETKSKQVYMNFTDYNKHTLDGRLKQMPLGSFRRGLLLCRD